jgi:hypothetical protein
LWMYAMLGLQPSRRVSANYIAMGTKRAGMKENCREGFKSSGTTSTPIGGFW